MREPRTETERAVFDLWTELRPDEAFIQGVDGCAGRFFVPTPARVRRILDRIARTQRSTEDPTERKLLASFRARIELREPAGLPEALVESLFGYMVKEGVNAEHIRGLAADGRRALDVRRAQLRGRTPAGMRALVQLACNGLSQILETVDSQLREPKARAAGADLGRSRSYARALRDLWDYDETPAQVEAAGLRMLRRELPHFKALVRRSAEELRCDPTAEAVTERLKVRRGLRPDQILPFLNQVRGPAMRVAHRHVVAINPEYTTEIIETPPYMVNVTPSGAAFEVDALTDHSKEIFLATTDERSAARPAPGELLNLLIHEEYGHCVHGSNSAHGFAATPRVLHIISSTFVCVSEGIAFQRELEFLPVLQEIAAGKLSGEAEDAFAEALEPWGGITAASREYEFLTQLWRMVRFLRVIGDARINSGKQDLARFVEWAHRTTGLERATVYYQLFPAHQVIGPGYASTYAIIGERIRELQQDALKRGKTLRDFNAYASSLGWPPKSVFEAELAAWVRGP